MNKRSKIVLALIIVLLIAFGVFYFVNQPKSDSNSYRINILLLGADARTSEHHGFTDSINVLSIDKKTKKTYILGIPRDTRVQIANGNVDKINHAYAYGSVDDTIATVENFLDIRIDYYVLVDFQDFKKMVDSVGGIDMNVPAHISQVRPELHGKVGMSHLTGEEALVLVRFRQDNQSEDGRMERHREAIKAITDKILKSDNILNSLSLLNQLRENVKTDIPPFETAVIDQLMNGFNLDNAEILIVPGEYTHINGTNYMIPDKNKTEEMVVKLGLRN